MIFPLRTTVLLPHILLPLHIFEPRYRDMTAEALADNRPIAIARIQAHEPEDEPTPAIEQTVGAGRIIKYEALEDGRYNILLAGVARVHVARELEQKHRYREVQGALIEGVVDDPSRLAESLRLLRELIFSLRRWKPAISSVMLRLLSDDHPPAVLLDRLTGTLVLTPDEQQRLLEELVVDARAEILLDKISQLLASCQSDDGSGGPLIN